MENREEKNRINIPEFLKTCKQDEKGRYIVPDEIMQEYYKELPEGTRNESKNRMAYNGGMINTMDDSEEAQEARRRGGYALQGKLKERRTFAETIEYMLAQQAKPEDIERFGLQKGATQQDAIMAAMMGQAKKGNVKAGTFLRDTIGQQPIAKQEITADIMTDADRELLAKVTARLGNSAQGKDA